jgi:GT2 family glycosyltransferase
LVRFKRLPVPDATPRPSLSIVIVTYNVQSEVLACLRSIAADEGIAPAEVVVVDNASEDGTPEAVRTSGMGVRVIDAGGNLGFSRANNLGIRATSGEYVLLLNPDTVVSPGAIPGLVRALTRHPGAAAAGPRLIDATGRAELSFGRGTGPLGELRQKVTGGLYRHRFPVVRNVVERQTREPGARAWVSGACVLLRRTDLEAVGLLDERFFMYMEDVDLCASLTTRGREILFVPDAEVVHFRGRSAGRNPQTERLRRLSQLAYFQKRHPAWLPLLRLYLRWTGRLPGDDGQRTKN